MRFDRRLYGAFVAGAAAALAAPLAIAQDRMSGDTIPTEQGELTIQPVSHATFAMDWDGTTVYVDPVGGAEVFEGLPDPDLVLLTDVHGDHLDADTLSAVVDADTPVVAPSAVAEQLPDGLRGNVEVVNNGEETEVVGIGLEAIPMYNLTEDRLDYHEKGRGNGYVATFADTRVYIAGDTEDIPEMRSLEDIDVAFVPFNLPYTMTEEQAASAVREFAPDIVYPYHYRGSDPERFAELVGEAGGIEVRLSDEWY